jgi:hypothetical protein
MRVGRRHHAITIIGSFILIVIAGDCTVFASTSLFIGTESVGCDEDNIYWNSCGYGSTCDFRLKCCPGEGGDCVYKYEKMCYCDIISCGDASNPSCDYYGFVCFDDTTAKNCSSVCPEMPPNTNDVCHWDNPQYVCKYAYPQVNAEPGYSTPTKDCFCNVGKFHCSCYGVNAGPVTCPTDCPMSPLVQGDECSVFDSGYCNYTQPCCDRGGGGICIANSTCFCDEANGTVNCTNLPITFCTASGIKSTKGDKRGQMNSKKKKLRRDMSKKKSMHHRNLGNSGRW